MAQADGLRRRVRERAGFAAAYAAKKVELDLIRNFSPHRKSGETQSAISVRLDSLEADSVTYLAKADTPQARYVNDGTPPHTIAPKGGSASGSKWPRRVKGERLLVFDWPKAGMFPARFRWVDHPGYKGSGWYDLALSNWHDYLAEGLSRAA